MENNTPIDPYRKISARIIPLMMLLYLMAFLDRVNISFAALTMNQDLGFTPTVFGWGAGIFFIGYFLFEVPSNVILEKVGARLWIARIMVTWGLISAAMAFVSGTASFLTLRFLLGVAEAGFFPGILVYLTKWFGEGGRSRALAGFVMASPAALVLGGPLSGLILHVHWLGLSGWRWIFILQGLPAVLLGIVTLRYLTDSPRQAEWLTAAERDVLAAGTGLADATAGYVMLFNILHVEDPVGLLREAHRVLAPGGTAGVIHWRNDIRTPRGPSPAIRPTADQCRAWGEAAGLAFERYEGLCCCSWHWGLVMRRP